MVTSNITYMRYCRSDKVLIPRIQCEPDFASPTKFVDLSQYLNMDFDEGTSYHVIN